MRQIPEAMQARLNREVTTLCRCFVLERKDGTRLGFTDHDEPLMIEGITCEAASGVEASSIEATLGLNVDSQDIEGALTSIGITEADIDAGRFDQARLRAYVVDWEIPGLHFLEQVYLIGEITREDGFFKAELRGLAAVLDQTKGRRFSRTCPVELGSAPCGIDLGQSQFNVTTFVTRKLTPMLIHVDGLAGFNDGWFRGGRATFTSGENAGYTIEIADHYYDGHAGVLSLWQPMPAEIDVGDALKLQVGCDKSFATCRDRFENSTNFQGFPHLPGNDFIIGYAANSQNMDGGPLFP